jgi:hypothetical protein
VTQPTSIPEAQKPDMLQAAPLQTFPAAAVSKHSVHTMSYCGTGEPAALVMAFPSTAAPSVENANTADWPASCQNVLFEMVTPACTGAPVDVWHCVVGTPFYTQWG